MCNWYGRVSLTEQSLPLLRIAKLNSFTNSNKSGFGGLVVSMLASGTRVREFEPGRSRGIFRVSE